MHKYFCLVRGIDIHFILQHRDNLHSSRCSCQLPSSVQVHWDLWEKVSSFLSSPVSNHMLCSLSIAFTTWEMLCEVLFAKRTHLCSSLSPDIPESLWLAICIGSQNWSQCGSREGQGSCAFCPLAKYVRVHWDLLNPRRAPPQQVGVRLCLRSWSTMSLYADSTMHSRTSGIQQLKTSIKINCGISWLTFPFPSLTVVFLFLQWGRLWPRFL